MSSDNTGFPSENISGPILPSTAPKAGDGPGLKELLSTPTGDAPRPSLTKFSANPVVVAPADKTDSKKPKREGLPGKLISIGLMLFAVVKYGLLIIPKLKFATTGISMVVSIFFYSLIFGWPFAVGFVLLILVHEYGHVFQARREGLPVTAPVFIPFLGAAIIMKDMPKDAAMEARIGIAGPILGSLGCLIPFALWQITGESIWQALTYTGVFINLFNLLPVVPLDGGRIMSAISTKLWAVGFAAIIALTVVLASPFMLLICLFAGFECYHRYKNRNKPETQAYHDIPKKTRAIIAASYIALTLVLGAATAATYVHHEDYQNERDSNTAQIAQR